MESEVNTPEVEAKAKLIKDGKYSFWELTVLCPFCGKKHFHGGGNGARPVYGDRVAHCIGISANYKLIPIKPKIIKLSEVKSE